MKVSHVMSAEVIAVTPKTSFRELWEAIFRKQVHALPVISQQKTLLGIISEEDLLKPLYPNYHDLIEDFVSASNFEEMEYKLKDLANLKAGELMCTKVIFTRPDTPLMRALSRMLVRGVRQLPVLSPEDHLIGMVSKSDIFDALFKKHLRFPRKNKSR